MTEAELLAAMVPPGRARPGIWRGGILQVWVTRACDLACFGCTQGSNLAGRPGMITVPQYEAALRSLRGYFGVVGMFGGNPAMHPQFAELCAAVRAAFPLRQRGIWCNHPRGRAGDMRRTFDPSVSNLNVHLVREAYDQFSRDWPESRPFLKGLDPSWPEARRLPADRVGDSRHAPPFAGMRDLGVPEDERRQLISRCDVNQRWSALIGVFRGGLRAWFCEVAGAQAMLHQDEPDYPDTGIQLTDYEPDPPEAARTMAGRRVAWWQLPMWTFAHQVRQHCHDCGVPLRPFGELAQGGVKEQVSAAHRAIYRPKVPGRSVELVTTREELGCESGRTVPRSTDYIENGGLR